MSSRPQPILFAARMRRAGGTRAWRRTIRDTRRWAGGGRSAAPARSGVFHRVGLALLGELRWLVEPSRHRADGQDARAVIAGDELAPLSGAHSGEHPGLEDVLLAADLEDHRALEDGVDLLHPVLGVIVLRIFGRIGRELLDLHAERPDAKAGASAAESAPEDRLEVLDALDGDVSHV